ncbi:MAG: polyprenyl synthetase family protein [Dehalococcoidia bacterium]
MTSSTAAPVALTRHRDAIEAALQVAVGPGDSAIERVARYVMGWEDEHGQPSSSGGKRIRPALALVAAEAVGGNSSDAMPGALAVELVHNFSLVHDEIQDHDAERHHRPTVYALIGEAQAINVGDFLYTRALHALTDGAGDVARRMDALGVLNRAIHRMLEGQWQDLDFEARDDVTVDDYLAMVAGKTGALLGAPMEIGALLAGASAELAAGLGRWGEQVGLAFQAQDDYLGTWGDPNETGKSNTNDILRRKKTLPIIHGLNDPDAGAVIRRAFADPEGPPDLADILRALELSGAAERCREQARWHVEAAAARLSRLAITDEARAELSAVASYLVERNS